MNNNKLNSLIQELKRPLILDGAMGSLIQQKGFKADKYLWMSIHNFINPNIIIEIHKNYIEAGSDIISTNTFRTNPNALKHTSYSDKEAVKTAIDIAIKAVNESILQNSTRRILIAGVNAPAEDCYQKEVTLSKNEIEENHKKHISALYEFGSDFILNETQSHFDEIYFICKFCNDNKIPFVLSLFVTEEFKMLSGHSIHETIQMIKSFSPSIISFNCISKKIFFELLSSINFDFDWGYYINCGSGKITDQNIYCGISPMEYSVMVKDSLKFSPKLIGACCGSNPDHISEIKRIIDELNFIKS